MFNVPPPGYFRAEGSTSSNQVRHEESLEAMPGLVPVGVSGPVSTGEPIVTYLKSSGTAAQFNQGYAVSSPTTGGPNGQYQQSQPSCPPGMGSTSTPAYFNQQHQNPGYGGGIPVTAGGNNGQSVGGPVTAGGHNAQYQHSQPSCPPGMGSTSTPAYFNQQHQTPGYGGGIPVTAGGNNGQYQQNQQSFPPGMGSTSTAAYLNGQHQTPGFGIGGPVTAGGHNGQYQQSQPSCPPGMGSTSSPAYFNQQHQNPGYGGVGPVTSGGNNVQSVGGPVTAGGHNGQYKPNQQSFPPGMGSTSNSAYLNQQQQTPVFGVGGPNGHYEQNQNGMMGFTSAHMQGYGVGFFGVSGQSQMNWSPSLAATPPIWQQGVGQFLYNINVQQEFISKRQGSAEKEDKKPTEPMLREQENRKHRDKSSEVAEAEQPKKKFAKTEVVKRSTEQDSDDDVTDLFPLTKEKQVKQNDHGNANFESDSEASTSDVEDDPKPRKPKPLPWEQRALPWKPNNNDDDSSLSDCFVLKAGSSKGKAKNKAVNAKKQQATVKPIPRRTNREKKRAAKFSTDDVNDGTTDDVIIVLSSDEETTTLPNDLMPPEEYEEEEEEVEGMQEMSQISKTCLTSYLNTLAPDPKWVTEQNGPAQAVDYTLVLELLAKENITEEFKTLLASLVGALD